MMMLVAIGMFGGALALALYTLAATVMPQWQRITEVLGGAPAVVRAAPVSARERAERRSAVRRWSAESAPAMIWRSREAA